MTSEVPTYTIGTSVPYMQNIQYNNIIILSLFYYNNRTVEQSKAHWGLAYVHIYIHMYSMYMTPPPHWLSAVLQSYHSNDKNLTVCFFCTFCIFIYMYIYKQSANTKYFFNHYLKVLSSEF